MTELEKKQKELGEMNIAYTKLLNENKELNKKLSDVNSELNSISKELKELKTRIKKEKFARDIVNILWNKNHDWFEDVRTEINQGNF